MSKPDEAKKLAKTIRHVLSEKKGEDLLLLDIRKLSSVADYFVIGSGTSTRHVDAMGDEVIRQLKALGVRPRSVEGLGVGNWVLLDYNEVIVHLFDPGTRAFYHLEKLWEDAPRVK